MCDGGTFAQFDALGRMTRIQQSDGASSAGYAVSNKRVDITYTQSGEFSTISRYADLAGTLLVATSNYGFDDAGRLTSLTHTKGTTTLASYGWQFDAQGRIVSQSSNDGTTTFSYDTNHQLTGADHSYQTDESYSYDLNGNRTNTGYVTGTNNRVVSDATYDYQYDDEGNRTRRTNRATGAYEEYAWDHRNRLTSVTFKTSAGVTTKKVQYAYDMFNRLISRRVDSNGDGTFDSGQRFVYDQAPHKGGQSDTVLVFDDSGSLAHRFLPGPAIDQVLAAEVFSDPDTLWFLHDHQNTVRDVGTHDAATDMTTVINHLQYDSFGNITSQTNSAYEPLLAWTGRYRDPETGLQWNLNRWYDPALGRWLSEDPIGFAAAETNLARYVGNSPMNFTDPAGLAPPGPGSDILDEALTGHNTGTVYKGGSHLAAGSQPSATFSKATQGEMVPFAEAFGYGGAIIVAGQPQPIIRAPAATGFRTPKPAGRPKLPSAADDFATGARVRPSGPRQPIKLADADPFPTGVNTTRGWKAGDPINNLTAKGNRPSWSAVRQRFWKNEGSSGESGCLT